MNLILFTPEEIGKPLPKRDERAVHLVKVLHKQVGETFEAGVLNGALGQGRITAIQDDGSLVVELVLQDPPPNRLPLRVAVGFPRPIQLRRLLRDLSSLGVSAIDLLMTDLGEKSYQDTNLLNDGGAEAALIEGAVQSRDTTLPVLSVFRSLDRWLSDCPWMQPPVSPSLRYIAPDNVRPAGAFADLPCLPGSAALLAIGPERGWSDRERGRLDAAGFLRLSMGRRALRTETACVAASVLALEKIGLLR
ncbi:MAG: 16S rRNA (uracil(1498)-N(3))-methyltransferase [Termitinemataceae bacterium]